MTQYVVVVERGGIRKGKTATVGPFTSKQAYANADLWNDTDGRRAWVEVIVPVEAYEAQHRHEVAKENRENPDV